MVGRALSWSSQFTNVSFKPLYKRLVALFACLILLFSTVAPSVSAAVAVDTLSHKQTGTNKHIKPKKPGFTTKEHKFNTPGGMQETTSKFKAAADAKPVGVSAVLGNSLISKGSEPLQGSTEQPKITPHELVDKRTATSSVSIKSDGSLVRTNYVTPHFYKKDNGWQVINTHLDEDKNAGDSTNIFGKALGQVESAFSSPHNYSVTENSWIARFSPSDANQGMVRVKQGNDQIGFTPVNANKVDPVITTDKNGKQTVHYYDLWSGVDVEYTVENTGVKEGVILKNKDATNKVAFHLSGASLEKNTSPSGLVSYKIVGALGDQFQIPSANLMLNNFGFETNTSVFSQDYQNGNIILSVKADYLKGLPAKAFPAVIDPGIFTSSFGTRQSGNYVELKTDGYVCPYYQCNVYAGSLYDVNYNLQYWRGAIFAPYDQFRDPNLVLTGATLHLTQFVNVGYWTGTYATHPVVVGHATCLNNFNCLEGGTFNASGNVTTGGDINVTNIYQTMISRGDFGAWLMIGSEDGTTSSFKDYDPDNSYVTFTYAGAPPAPSMSSPTTDQVYADTQPSITVGAMQNPNGSTPLQYQIRVSSGSGGTGTLVNSGLQSTTTWSVPDDVLQDGATYYAQARVYDPITALYSSWGTSVPFHINLRMGSKDKSQAYDTMGPVSTDLATGNLTTSTASHTSAALGGSLGINLNYNSPLKSRTGLVGRYWNVPSNYSGGLPTSAPQVTRVDQNVNFDWGSGSPAPGIINNDWYYVVWDGYFVPSAEGYYYFGGNHDDYMSVTIDQNLVYASNGCSTLCSSGYYLSAWEAVPIHIEYKEWTGNASIHLHVTTPDGTDHTDLADWLQTGVRDATQHYGLTGRYYADDGSHDFNDPTNQQSMFVQRNDNLMSFNWGAGSPVSGGPVDNFMARWTGYLSVPVTGTYQIGTIGDDGTRVTVSPNGTANQVINNWVDNGGTPVWSSGVTLSAGQQIPIQVDYYEHSGSASLSLMIQSSNLGIPQQVIPTEWLTPNAQILPAGWKLDLDVNGNLSYDHLAVTNSSAILTNAAGDSFEYTWTGSGYRPPVNSDGHLVRNVDGTFTLQDSNGMTYVFGADGNLTSATSAVTDVKPAALQYDYQSTNGGPAHLYRIRDGVDSSRSATLYFSGDSSCGSAPAGFDANAPAGMLCALITNDGRVTYFYYMSGQLARVALPGAQLTDYRYEQVTSLTGGTIGYRLNAVRDSLAMDFVALGDLVPDDDTPNTLIIYDALGRAHDVTGPAEDANTARLEHTYYFYPGAKDTVDANGNPVPGYSGMTVLNSPNEFEPNEFSRRIKYDNLFRTIEDTTNTNLSTHSQWDPQKDLLYSTTDPTGLMSTTVYDDEDRPVSSYGPAPAAWFNTANPKNQVPLSAYSSKVPRINTGYDENIVGPAVAWLDYSKQPSNASGMLYGAPKLHTTGINSTAHGTLSNTFSSPPITASSGKQGIGFSATGRLRLPVGAYTFSANTPDGVRLWIDDQLVVNQWTDSSTSRITSGAFTISDTLPHRFQLDVYRRTGVTGTFSLTVQQQGGFAATTDWSSYLKPDYSLSTSATVYDSTLGSRNATNNYGSNPELSLLQSTTIDPSGLALTTSNTYETQGATGSFLRETSTSLPGNTAANPTYAYTYYGATETRDNPCTTPVEAYKQAGFVRTKTTADPDGTGAQTGMVTELVYDDAGRIVASRINNGGWSCTTYDSRGRISTSTSPAHNGEAARTVGYDYAEYGMPFVQAISENGAEIDSIIDINGRTTEYADANSNVTDYSYEVDGRMISQSGFDRYINYDYDEYGRLTDIKRGDATSSDTTTYATIYYDQYSRIDHITYDNAGGMRLTPGRDSLGRLATLTYTLGDGTTTISDTTNLTQSGRVLNDIVQSGSNQLWQTYSYDAAGRLTGASIGPHTFTYGFGVQNSSCGAGSNMNANAGKNGNRTSQIIDGVTTTYCYNYADQLVSSSDPTLNGAQYDDHGNITQIGTGSSPLRLYYDSSDRNWGLVQYNSSGNGTAMYYSRDAADRITYREQDAISAWNWNMTGQYWYGYVNNGDTPAFIRDANWNIVEENLSLPGGVLLTLRPQQQQANSQKQYNLPSALGHTLLTTDATGANTSNGNGPLNSFTYDPFGNVLSGSNKPANTVLGGSYGFGGSHAKVTEASLTLTPIQMGARIYLPTLGRFTSVDPVLGGNANAYVYVLDPINSNDYGGKCAFFIQCTISVTILQPAATTTSYQSTISAAQTQSMSAAIIYVRIAPTTTRAAAKPMTAKVSPLQRLGNNIGSVASGAWRATTGAITGYTQRVGSSSGFKGAVSGCRNGAQDTAALGLISDYFGGPEIGWGEVGYGCLTGAYSGFMNVVLPGSGQLIENVDHGLDEYNMYNFVVNM